MKKTISVLIALMAFAFCMNACTNAQAKQNRSHNDIKEEVARRVKEIYDTVIPWYNSHEGDIRSVNDFDERFLSKDMQMMGAQVGAILRELHEKGEDDIPPGYDYDHWVMGQDWENLSIRTDSVCVLSPDTAEAYMRITNYGSPQKFMLMMTRDEKEWFIDDFRLYDERVNSFAFSDKRNIQDYINENSPSASKESLMCYEPTPQFPGGDEACQEFIRRNIRYSDEMIQKGIKGRVVVGFKVEKDGSLTNLRIKKSSDARLNNEALRVVKSMPKWEPAQKDGKPIEMDFNLPVMFQLNSPVFYIADSVYLYPDERAMFPGGDAACQEWLRDRVRYPADCQREKLGGRVLVTFVVRYNGIITDAKVVHKVDPRLEEEALYAIRNMPKWIPAKMKGKAVSSRYTIPVLFSLKETQNH